MVNHTPIFPLHNVLTPFHMKGMNITNIYLYIDCIWIWNNLNWIFEFYQKEARPGWLENCLCLYIQLHCTWATISQKYMRHSVKLNLNSSGDLLKFPPKHEIIDPGASTKSTHTMPMFSRLTIYPKKSIHLSIPLVY